MSFDRKFVSRLQHRLVLSYLDFWYLRTKDSEVVKATAPNISLEVVPPIILFDLLPMLGEGSFFGSLFGCRSHVI